MSLETGARLGPYEILSPLGAGGMGEVYRARDTRLDRIVAVKVLPSHLSASPEVRARFEREARVVSSLNHPNICTLHDVGHHEGIDYLVMEHIEGETLAARLQRGPLPLADLLRIARQVADALEKAHRSGIVHRDLKPGNIMLTRAGAKLLDFGLARPTGLGSAGGQSLSPTMTRPLTAEGSIVGTFQYMAPEQLEGKEADARTDIFSFGAVLYEMATGRRAFTGQSQASLITAIMSSEPTAVSALIPLAPPALERVIRLCLAKDPDERIQTAHDVRLQLEWIGEAGSGPGAAATAGAPARGAGRERLAWAVAAVSFVLAAAALAGAFRNAAPARRIISAIEAPESAELSLNNGPMSFSPDGRKIALVAKSAGGKERLWVRALDQVESRELAGTDDARCPFWSPDGESIGFFAQGKLKKVELAGGQPETLAAARTCLGASWGADGSILYVPDTFSPVMKVSASGGPPSAVTPSSEDRVNRYMGWPLHLPDGRHFLYTVNAESDSPQGGGQESGIFVGSLDTPGERRRVLPTLSNAALSPDGYLIYAKDGALRAQRFDLKRFEVQGEPIPLAERIQYLPAFSCYLFAVSDNGQLAYLGGVGAEKTHFAWFDRSGALVEDLPLTALLYAPRLSHDGQRLAFDQSDPLTDSGDIWVYDFKRKVSDRVTYDPLNESWPSWSPDGTRIVFFRNIGGLADIYLVNANGSGAAEPLIASPERKRVTDWSRDGRQIAFESTLTDSPTRTDLWLYSFDEKKASPWLVTPFNEADARFSPDGRWIAYRSDESGRDEVYVRERSSGGGKWRVSSEGGGAPRWRADGRELFFFSLDEKLMSVAVSPEAAFSAGTPAVLFKPQHLASTSSTSQYDVSADGQRFLLDVRASGHDRTSITLVTEWTAAVRKD